MFTSRSTSVVNGWQTLSKGVGKTQAILLDKLLLQLAFMRHYDIPSRIQSPDVQPDQWYPVKSNVLQVRKHNHTLDHWGKRNPRTTIEPFLQDREQILLRVG